MRKKAKMAILVTGATGFLGGHVARLLNAQGADLRLLVRPTSRLDNLEGLRAERVMGDLRDPTSLRAAVRGCQIVFHVAARLPPLGPPPAGTLPQQRGGHGQPAGRRGRVWGGTDRLHQHGRHPSARRIPAGPRTPVS